MSIDDPQGIWEKECFLISVLLAMFLLGLVFCTQHYGSFFFSTWLQQGTPTKGSSKYWSLHHEVSRTRHSFKIINAEVRGDSSIDEVNKSHSTQRPKLYWYRSQFGFLKKYPRHMKVSKHWNLKEELPYSALPMYFQSSSTTRKIQIIHSYHSQRSVFFHVSHFMLIKPHLKHI